MNFKQTPHPLVEDHYYIQELIAGQQKRVDARVRWQEQKKNEDAFLKGIADFKDVELLDFYCSHCDKDFMGRAKKQTDSWAELAYYKIKHRCGTWAIRHITDRELDPYFARSRKVAQDRAINSLQMLQPFETGFNMVYGKQTRSS